MIHPYTDQLAEPWDDPRAFQPMSGDMSHMVTMPVNRWQFEILCQPRPDRSTYPQHWHWLIGHRA